MTAFASNQIPAYVNTIEKLAAWSCSILADLNPTQSIVTGPGQSERLAQSYPLFFANNTPATERLVVVAYLPLPTDYRGQGSTHKAALELGNASIPGSYLAA